MGDQEEGYDYDDYYEEDYDDDEAHGKLTEIQKLQKQSPEDLFKKFDTDNSGTIDYDEFVALLPKLGVKMTEAKALKYFRVCDQDGSGNIDIEEFKLALFACDPVNGNPIGFEPSSLLTPQDAFEMFDEDGSGNLDEDEYFVLLEYLGLEVSDARQESLFNKYDKDGSGFIDYEEFKQIWLKLSNVKVELANRGVQIPKYATHGTLVEMLEKKMEEEEETEARSLAEAKRWKIWQAERRKKALAIGAAKHRASIELATALDSGGQVYVFGTGEQDQFVQLPLQKPANSLQFEGFAHIKEIWRARVRPTRMELEEGARVWADQEQSEEEKMHAEAKAAEHAPLDGAEPTEDDLYKDNDMDYVPSVNSVASRFFHLNAASNTCMLWGRRVVHCAIAESNIFALNDLGDVYSWGGHDHWWHEIEPDSHYQHHWRGDTTERSQKLLMTTNMPLLEDPIPEEHQTSEEATCEKFKVVGKYYDVWEPAPSAHSRLIYLTSVVIPKIDLEWLHQSVELRCRPVLEMSKMELVDEMHLCITHEVGKLGKRTHREIASMDKDVRELKKQNKKSVIKVLAKRIKDLWGPLNVLIEKEIEADKADAAKAKLRKEQEEDYNHAQWRKHVHSARFDHEPVYTERGNSRVIQVSGITDRGAGLNTPRGMQACVQVAAGAFHASVVHANGEMYTWGSGTSGRLGHDDTEHGNPRSDCDRPTLVQAFMDTPVVQVSLGFNHSAALVDGNELFVWGSATGGKLGLGEVTEEYECFCAIPTCVPIPAPVAQVSCGSSHTACVTVSGELYIWGVADGGRLGLGERMQTQLQPVLVESLLHERILTVSCGNNHTMCNTATQDKWQGDGLSKTRVSVGGDVYVAGSATALGRWLPSFTRMEELRGQAVRQVSAGYGHSAALSSEGELFTWGGNRNGCCGHPLPLKFVGKPTVVAALFQQPKNLALGKGARQSTIYNNAGPDRCTDGNLVGDGEKHVCHTQMDPQPWWEVDLGAAASILTIKLWNRTDEPFDPAMEPNTFTRRLLPCWVMVSHYPFGDVVGGKSLEMALAKSDARKRFKHDRRLLTWHCPEGTVGRYIRVQLENMDYLHFAQLEVIGMYGEEKALGRVSSVTCGHDITAAVIRPLADARDLEESYRRAVIADPMNLVFLRQYETFIREFEQVGASACAVPCAVMRCVVRGVTFRVQHRMFVSESESSVACACCHPASAPVAYPPSAPLAARSPPRPADPPVRRLRGRRRPVPTLQGRHPL
jgi:Ca2+-binding EF-hand superfamily protein